MKPLTAMRLAELGARPEGIPYSSCKQVRVMSSAHEEGAEFGVRLELMGERETTVGPLD